MRRWLESYPSLRGIECKTNRDKVAAPVCAGQTGAVSFVEGASRSHGTDLPNRPIKLRETLLSSVAFFFDTPGWPVRLQIRRVRDTRRAVSIVPRDFRKPTWTRDNVACSIQLANKVSKIISPDHHRFRTSFQHRVGGSWTVCSTAAVTAAGRCADISCRKAEIEPGNDGAVS